MSPPFGVALIAMRCVPWTRSPSAPGRGARDAGRNDDCTIALEPEQRQAGAT
jgi:hypothetical protein